MGEDDWLEFAYESANGADVELEEIDPLAEAIAISEFLGIDDEEEK